jgi:hypothetical protein
VECPICRQALEGGELVMVCGACHRSIGGGSSGLSVHATGEFRIPTPEMLEMGTAAPVSAGERVSAESVCAWCHKDEAQVKKLLGRNGVALCDECVSLCCDIFEAELGPGWQS